MVVEQISHVVYQAILVAQHHPHYFADEKYCSTKPKQSVLTQELSVFLTASNDGSSFLLKLKRLLQQIFLSDFFESLIFTDMAEKVLVLLADNPAVEPEQNHPIATNTTTSAAKGSVKEAIAILLLDAENLNLDPKTELFLSTLCQYPVQIKIAFANWKAMGKRDIEFHSRGYQMIHVPAGKNSADMEMTAFGSAILAQYPAAREVIVCASDSDLNHLKNRLQSHGLVVYSVRHNGDNIVATNHRTGHTRTFNPNQPDIPTIDQFIAAIKQIIKTEQETTKTTWVKLSTISRSFHQAHQLTVSQVISSYHLHITKVKDFFLNYPAEFVVHQPSEQSEAYIMLFSVENAIANSIALEEKVAPSPAQATPVNSSVSKTTQIKSEADLEARLIGILRKLMHSSKQDYHPVSIVGAEFRKQYGESVTSTIKALKLSVSLTKFLNGHSTFTLRQDQSTWHVALAKV